MNLIQLYGKWKDNEVGNMNPQDILIGVLSAAPYDHRRNLVRETWGADCDRVGIEYHFLIGDNVEAPEQNVLFPDFHLWILNCPDAYQFLPQKTRLFCHRALQFPNWKWLLKTDDDAFLSIPRLLRFTPPGEYVGAEWQEGVGYGSGAGYFISRRAAEILAEKMRIKAGAEDLIAGVILKANGIKLTIDNEHIIPFASSTHRGTTTNNVIITHRLLQKDSPLIDREPWMLCHQETGLDASIDAWREPA